MPADTAQLQSAIVVGAGIAGLTAALALAAKGIDVHVIEQTLELSEVGAGLQVSPNGARILDQLGALAALRDRWTEPESVTLASGASLSPLTTVPLGSAGLQRWGAPYGVLHRATLHKALIEKVSENRRCTLHLGHRIDIPVIADLEAIAGGPAGLIVGADGVWSRMRRLVPGAGSAQFTGFVAWRFVVPQKDAPNILPRDRVTAFTGPDAHVVAYPLKEVGGFNLVAISHGADPGPAWSVIPSQEQRQAFVDQAFDGWHPDLKRLLLTAENPTWWPLFGVSDGLWTDTKKIALVGDAAHAMLPFAAQGAVMAIEDGFELAAQVSQMPLGAALRSFEALRRPRVRKVKARGDFNRVAYHARGPMKVARDALLALRPASSMAASMDWVYGHRAGEAKS